jgi:uncharacterized protein
MLVLETSEPARESVPAARPKTRKPRVWTAFATLFVAAIVGTIAVIAAYFTLGVGNGLIMALQGANRAQIHARTLELCRQPFVALLLLLIPFQLGMTAVVLFAARWSNEPIKQRLGLVRPTGRAFGGFKLATMAAFTFSAASASILLFNLLVGPSRTVSPIAAVITDASWRTITLLSIIVSVIPALVEESLFRGYLQRRFLERWSPAVAISVSSLLFALMHMDSLHHIIAVVPLGLVTGLLAYRTNSVLPGMLVHAVHNTAAVGFGALVTVLTPQMGQGALGLLLIATIGVLGLIGLPAVVSLLRSAKPQASVETHAAPEPVVESLSARGRELTLPNYAIDSRRACPAV